MNYDAELRDWAYTENMGIGQYHGYIYGDKKGRFEDGTYVHTSKVIELSGDIVQTQYSKYKLIEKVRDES